MTIETPTRPSTTWRRRISDATYLALYAGEVREYAKRWTLDSELLRWHHSLSYGELGSYKDDTAALIHRIRDYRERLCQLTGSARLYTVDAAGKRVEWRPEETTG